MHLFYHWSTYSINNYLSTSSIISQLILLANPLFLPLFNSFCQVIHLLFHYSTHSINSLSTFSTICQLNLLVIHLFYHQSICSIPLSIFSAIGHLILLIYLLPPPLLNSFYRFLHSLSHCLTHSINNLFIASTISQLILLVSQIALPLVSSFYYFIHLFHHQSTHFSLSTPSIIDLLIPFIICFFFVLFVI